MKNLQKITVLLILSALVLNVSGQTLKERIDEAKTVKVYFKISDVKHEPNTTAIPGSQKKGTGCTLFTQTTPMPENYVAVVKQVIDQLNKGFNTTAFVEGDLSAVPLVESGVAKGNPDWVKLGEPLTTTVSLDGSYRVDNMGLMNEVKLSNSVTISSGIGFYAIVKGKAKAITVKNLGTYTAPSKESKTCGDYDYFVKNFPVADYFDTFKENFDKKTADFIEKEMADYEKAMKKK
ncbi:MAG TPA: hypothetical protein VMV47_14235 [Bacteroidales bacterium]|nr:hypothetical protein [Bacteroidales bacterium]